MIFNLNHNSIKFFEKLILFFVNIFNFFTSKDHLRIIVYHDIEDKNFKLLYNQLKYLKKNWNFITPEQFEDHLKRKRRLKGKNLLITFDDGFKSNYFIAQKILNRLNIKGIFFIPSDFVKFKEKTYNISINNLKTLIKKGHKIGCHSKTHVNLGLLKDKIKLKKEILVSGNTLEKLLDININHFAFTYGNFNSMSEKSFKIALPRYEFIYSCLRGNNFNNNKKTIIKRDTVYLNKGNDLLNIFLSGIIDLKYLNQVRKINRLIQNNL